MPGIPWKWAGEYEEEDGGDRREAADPIKNGGGNRDIA